MKQLDTHLANLFHYVDSLSKICLIVLKDLEEEKYTIFQQKIIQDIENWCQKVLKKLSIFLEKDKFIKNKTCICIKCTNIFGNNNGNILQIYYKILNLLPEVNFNSLWHFLSLIVKFWMFFHSVSQKASHWRCPNWYK